MTSRRSTYQPARLEEETQHDLPGEASSMLSAITELYVADEEADSIIAYELLCDVSRSPHINETLSAKIADDRCMRKLLRGWLEAAVRSLAWSCVELVTDGHGKHWVTGLRPSVWQCRTPGCTRPDEHGGACSSHERTGRRASAADELPVALPPLPVAEQLREALLQVARLRCQRDALLVMAAAPHITAATQSDSNGGLLGRHVSMRTALGQFDGRVIRELSGSVRVLWYDREGTYTRAHLSSSACVHPALTQEVRPTADDFEAELPRIEEPTGRKRTPPPSTLHPPRSTLHAPSLRPPPPP